MVFRRNLKTYGNYTPLAIEVRRGESRASKMESGIKLTS